MPAFLNTVCQLPKLQLVVIESACGAQETLPWNANDGAVIKTRLDGVRERRLFPTRVLEQELEDWRSGRERPCVILQCYAEVGKEGPPS